MEILGSYGNDFVNFVGSNQDLEIMWSPGNDVYFTDLKDNHNENAEFQSWSYNNFVNHHLQLQNPNGLTYDNSKGPALEVSSDYGTIIAYNVQEIETTNYNDTIIGRDNYYDNIRLYKGQDVVTTGYGSDVVRTKPHDTDNASII